MESQVLINTAINSRMCMCHMPAEKGLNRSGLVVRTVQERESRVEGNRHHLGGAVPAAKAFA